MEPVKISNTDKNADWIKWRTDDVKVSELAKKLLQIKALVWNAVEKAKRGRGHWGHRGRKGKRGGSLPSKGKAGLSPKPSKPLESYGVEQFWFQAELGGQTWDKAHPSKSMKLESETAAKLADKTGIPKETVAEVLDQWNRQNMNEDMRGLSLHEDAAKEFGLDLPKYLQERINKAQASGDPDKRTRLLPSDKQRELLRAMYDETQRELKDRGLEEVVLYRGVTTTKDLGWYPNADVVSDTNPLSSWSSGKPAGYNKAREFAASYAWRDDTHSGAVVKTYVPAERVFSLPMTGLGDVTEGEFVILGGKGDGMRVVDVISEYEEVEL